MKLKVIYKLLKNSLETKCTPDWNIFYHSCCRVSSHISNTSDVLFLIYYKFLGTPAQTHTTALNDVIKLN
jgi:hypothetical protein